MRTGLKQNKLFLTLFVLCFLVLVKPILAIDRVTATTDSTKVEVIKAVDSLPHQFEPFIEIAFGLSQRTDETKLINYSPQFITKIYYHLSENVSGKFGIGYSTPNNFKSSTWETISYRNLKFEAGVRFDLFGDKVKFYHENGIEYNYYYEPKSAFWEQRIGVNASLGIVFNIQRNLNIDISINQTINDGTISSPTKNIKPSEFPIGLQDNRFFNETFNPTTLQILFFKKL